MIAFFKKLIGGNVERAVAEAVAAERYRMAATQKEHAAAVEDLQAAHLADVKRIEEEHALELRSGRSRGSIPIADLTDGDRDVLRCLAFADIEHKNLEDIAAAAGFTKPQTLYHLERLEKAGMCFKGRRMGWIMWDKGTLYLGDRGLLKEPPGRPAAPRTQDAPSPQPSAITQLPEVSALPRPSEL